MGTLDFTVLFNSLPGAFAQGLIWGIMAIGVYLTYRVLDFSDLTVDGSLATGGGVFIISLTSGKSMVVSLLMAVLAGIICGLVTGLFNTLLGIPPILAGILTQIGLYSINLKILDGSNLPISVRNYKLLVSLAYLTDSLIVLVILTIAIIAFLYWFFGTEKGCSIRATGCNPNMARAQGINTNVNKVIGLCISNGLVGLAGALLAQYSGAADVNMGRGSIVTGLAAVIIGEAIFGKIFKNFALKLLSVSFGAILYYIIIQLILWFEIDPNLLKAFQSIVVAVFLAIPYIKAKYFSKPKKIKTAIN